MATPVLVSRWTEFLAIKGCFLDYFAVPMLSWDILDYLAMLFDDFAPDVDSTA
jgi:hypothetical protein